MNNKKDEPLPKYGFHYKTTEIDLILEKVFKWEKKKQKEYKEVIKVQVSRYISTGLYESGITDTDELRKKHETPEIKKMISEYVKSENFDELKKRTKELCNLEYELPIDKYFSYISGEATMEPAVIFVHDDMISEYQIIETLWQKEHHGGPDSHYDNPWDLYFPIAALWLYFEIEKKALEQKDYALKVYINNGRCASIFRNGEYIDGIPSMGDKPELVNSYVKLLLDQFLIDKNNYEEKYQKLYNMLLGTQWDELNEIIENDISEILGFPLLIPDNWQEIWRTEQISDHITLASEKSSDILDPILERLKEKKKNKKSAKKKAEIVERPIECMHGRIAGLHFRNLDQKKLLKMFEKEFDKDIPALEKSPADSGNGSKAVIIIDDKYISFYWADNLLFENCELAAEKYAEKSGMPILGISDFDDTTTDFTVVCVKDGKTDKFHGIYGMEEPEDPDIPRLSELLQDEKMTAVLTEMLDCEPGDEMCDKFEELTGMSIFMEEEDCLIPDLEEVKDMNYAVVYERKH